MTGASHCAPRAIAGQALTECLIGCLLLVPLWWFMQHWIEGEARRAALQSQVRVVALRESLAPGSADAIRGSSLERQLDAQITRRATPSVAGSIERAAFALLAPVQALAPGRLDLGRDGWIRADVTVDAPAHRFWLRGPRRWRESLTLLIDDWSLPGPRAVERRTQTLLPTTPLEPVVATLGGQAAAQLLEPALRSTCARRIDPEVVPHDRLVTEPWTAAALRPASRWRPRC